MKSSLKNRRIAVTRASSQISTLKKQLEKRGADVLEIPLIKIKEYTDRETEEDVFAEIGTYEWIVFTSANGVKYFFKQFLAKFQDIRALGIMRIASIGKGTTKALSKYYLTPDLVPDQADGLSLAKKLVDEGVEHHKVLVITGNQNRETLVDVLHKSMAIVDTLQVYETLKTDLSTNKDAERFCKEGADALVFCSSSAVNSFVDQASSLQTGPKAIVPKTFSIGKLTSETMKEKHLPVDVTAHEASIESLVEAIEKRFSEE